MFCLRSKTKSLQWFAAILMATVFCTCIGCGGSSEPVGTVTGKVLLNDEPYSDASVVFMCLETGQTGLGEVQSDGTFTLAASLPVGTYKVYLEPAGSDMESEQPTPMAMGGEVPAKYWNEASTDISIDIKEGENEVTVPLVE